MLLVYVVINIYLQSKSKYFFKIILSLLPNAVVVIQSEHLKAKVSIYFIH